MKKCLACNGEMEKGLIADNAHGGGVFVSQFVEGEYDTSSPVAQIRNVTKRFHTTAYKCKNCGMIQSYAENKSFSNTQVSALQLRNIVFALVLVIGLGILVFLVSSSFVGQ